MFNLFSKTKPVFPYIEAPIVSHCNLKCNNCCNFCNYVEDEFYVDLEEYIKDLKTLSQKVEIQQLRIMGGEPLLHPRLNDFIKESRKILPDAELNIVTNGILLPSRNEDFWDLLKATNTIVDYSLYPINKDKHQEIISLVESHNIKCNKCVKYKFAICFNEKGNSNQDVTFEKCYSKQFINLWNHNLYKCGQFFRQFYNQRFNTNLTLPPAYNIYKFSGKKLYENLISKQKSFEACKYCHTFNKVVDWSKSENSCYNNEETKE